VLDIHGPSEPIDTACSSSLIAIHRAVRSIHDGDCDMAIAGGVSAILTPMAHISFSKAGMLSEDGRCKTFDKKANGYVRGEGAGAVLLKPLSKAIRDGDHIYGVSRGSAENHGGHVSSLTVPNPLAQAELLQGVYTRASIEPWRIGYIECHGTGTALGDPVEVNGLKRAFSAMYDKCGKPLGDERFCGLGTVKTNIGHLEAAAGIAGFIKVLLSMQHKVLPGVVHFQELNPHIDFEGVPFYIVHKTMEWAAQKDKNGKELTRIAGVSSFGFGGANAHIALEEYVEDDDGQRSIHNSGESSEIVVLSAKNKERLDEYAKSLLGWLEDVQRDVSSDAFADVREALITDLTDEFTSLLGLHKEDVDADVCFEEYGLDEFKSASLAESLNEKYDIDLSVEAFAEINTLENLAAYLLTHYSQKLVGIVPAQQDMSEKEEYCKDNLNLEQIAYTLQVGRDAMNERLAIVAHDLDELKAKLAAYLQGHEMVEGVHADNAKVVTDKDAIIGKGEADRNYIRDLLSRGNMNKIAALWANGSEIDWESFYSDRPRRISLPTYPFKRGRYWLPEGANSADQAVGMASRLHELIDSNISTLEAQCYQKKLIGNEFFLRDHIVSGVKVLPGVVYLEMARVAGEFAENRSKAFCLSGVTWLQPVIVDAEGVELSVNLYPTGEDVGYEITSFSQEVCQNVVHSQGKIRFGKADERLQSMRVDVDSIRDRCRTVVDKERCYQLFHERGLAYGPSFQVIRELRHSDSESFAELEVPAGLEETLNQYVLHPSLMDGLLQSVLGVMSDVGEGIYVPFSVGEVEILRPMEPRCYAYVQLHEGGTGEMRRFDLALVNASGEILVRLNDFAVRLYGRQRQNMSESGSEAKKAHVLSLEKKWVSDEAIVSKMSLKGTLLLVTTKEAMYDLVKGLVGDDGRLIHGRKSAAYRKINEACYELRTEKLEDFSELVRGLGSDNIHPDTIIFTWDADSFAEDEKSVCETLEEGIFSLYSAMRALAEAKPQGNIKILCLMMCEGENPFLSALSGFARSINQENRKFQYKLVYVDKSNSDDELSQILTREVTNWGKNGVEEIQYSAGLRSVQRIIERPVSAVSSEPSLFKQGGIYVITGGMGGLGGIFARYLSKTYGAKLVLSGRRRKDEHIEALLHYFTDLGGEAIYYSCDVTQRDEAKGLLQAAREQYGRVDGILHAAGVLKDAILVKKTREDMESVINPKIYGAINLDEASREDDLDVFIMFSSIAGVMGNVGQSDYAYANQFMDAFSTWRSGLVERGARKGKTLSVDWPLWKQGGMAVDEETLQWMQQTMGMLLLPTEDGIQVLESGLQGDQSVVSFFYGDVRKLRSFFGVAEEGEASQKIDVCSIDVNQEVEKELFEKLRCDVVKLVSDLLKVKEDDVHIDEDMSEYGFDSITVTAFANKINALYNLSLMPAIFFEHFTIASILHYLISQYGETLRSHYALQGGEVERPVKGEDAKQPETRTHVRFRSARRVELLTPSREQEPIAVIGMSGMFPCSSNLVEFWRSLEGSKDLITEIPPDRWNWQEYFGDPMGGPNRTTSKWGGFMKQVDEFDAAFFNISSREAMLMDPQQRLFLQTVWQCIEDAGYKVRSLSGSKTGLFVGVASSDYREVLHQANIDINAYMPTGLAHSVLANRISYLLDFHGPSEPIDTACSSSLIAIHRAVRSIQDGDCEMAIAGGVNVILTPTLHIAFGQAGMLSPEGRCRTFDESADGYVRGEGVGAVLLKRSSEAERDGDHIYGVIRATGENHGGHVNALTVPNPVAQAELLMDVYERAGIEPWRVGYIECHGTGTSLGDPVEVNGLKRAFAELYKRHGKQFQGSAYCGLGTVKTNIGHLEAAAGIAGFIKALLSMKHKQLPGIVHFQTLNPQIEISDTPFYIVEHTRPWECAKDESGREYPRVMGVSSFGFGGANAHVAVEEWCERSVPDETQKEQGQKPEIILLSAKDEDRLCDYIQEYIAYLEDVRERGDQTLHDIAYTLQVGRDAFEERLSLVVNNFDDLIDMLQRYQAGEQGGDQLHRGKASALKDKAVLLDEGDDAVGVIANLFHERRYNRLAALWANGLDIDWSQIYLESAHQARRLSLPVYPFEKKRFWPERKQPMHSQMCKQTQGYGANQKRINSMGDEPGLGSVVQSLMSIIASRSTVDNHTLDASMRLGDVGVDSVAMLEIAGDVISQFPFMESNGTELLKSFQSMTIEEIARIICNSRHETPSEDQGTAHEIDNAFDFHALNFELKSDKQNILCDSVHLVTKDPLKLEGCLIVDEGHPFFFDHPLDHISGMQLVESMIQMCSLACQYAFGRDGEIAYLMNSKVSFRNFCKKDQPSMLLAVAGEGKNDDKVLHYYSGEILQNGKPVASGLFGFQSLNVDERCQDGQPDTGMVTEMPDMVPCAADIINKTRPENVIISQVENAEMGMGCWMLPLRKHAFFSDHAYGLLHGAQILEACRQSLRAVEYSMRKKQKQNLAFSHEGKMALLHDMSMSLKRPLRSRDVVFIKSMDPVITKVGNNILMRHETVLLVEGEDVGSCKVSAMVLEKEMYNGWRDDGISASLKMKE
jgi:polyketide synthase PksN